MRLSLIAEGYKSSVRKLQPIIHDLPASKQKHSKRVAKNLHNIGVGSTGIHAGLTHDYLEAGGNLEKLIKYLEKCGNSERIIEIVSTLSNDEKQDQDTNDNYPLVHLKSVLSKVSDNKTKNLVVLVKLSDRLDNLEKRVRKDRLSKNYRRKSIELVRFCQLHYTGSENKINDLVQKIMTILS